MEKILIGALVLAVIFLGARLWCYRRQINYLLKQISLLEQEDTNYCLSSCYEVTFVKRKYQKKLFPLNQPHLLLSDSIRKEPF